MTTYIVGLAKSNRSGCKGKCKEKIDLGELRFGSIGGGPGDYDMTYWRKIGCLTQKVCKNALAVHGAADKIPGYDELPESDQKRVTDVFDSLAIYGVLPSDAPSGTVTPSEEAEPEAAPKSKKAKKAPAAKDKAPEKAKSQKAAETKAANAEAERAKVEKAEKEAADKATASATARAARSAKRAGAA